MGVFHARQPAVKCAENTGFCAQKTKNLGADGDVLWLALFVTLRRAFVPFSPPESAHVAAHQPDSLLAQAGARCVTPA
jgi:hypothetical protein